MTDQYASEEVASTYCYPAAHAVRPIEEQIAALSTIFGLDPTQALAYIAKGLPELPDAVADAMEGWFAIPSPTSHVTVDMVTQALADTRRFRNYREGELGPDHLRRSARTAGHLAKIAGQQPGDILVVPAQLGMRYRGNSVRRARKLFIRPEFGFGITEAGSILLTHPARLTSYEDLWIDCAGDEYDYPGVDGRFDYAPFFSVGSVELFLGAREVSYVRDKCGSVSGFNLAA